MDLSGMSGVPKEASIKEERKLIAEFLEGRLGRKPKKMEVLRAFAEIFKNNEPVMSRGGITLSYDTFKRLRS